MVGRHPEHLFEPHGLLPRHVPHRRLAGRESRLVRRGPHDRTNARAERAPLPRPPQARVCSAVEGRAGRPLRRPRAERPVLGSVNRAAYRTLQGDVLWQRVLAVGGTWSPVGMAVAPDGTVYFTGQLGANYSSGTVVGKVLSDGTLAFSKFTSAFVAPNAIAYDPVSGGALITGTVNWSPPTGGIFAVDANGSFRWGSFANGTAVPYDAAIDGNGTAFIVTTRLLNGRLDAGFVAFDESGTLLHERRLDLPNDEYGWSVTLGPDGDPYYLGFSYQNYDPISPRLTPDLLGRRTES